MIWRQDHLALPSKPRGCHLINAEIIDRMPRISDIGVGMLHLFLQHTSASLTINENADPDVRRDLEFALNAICPESMAFRHTCEGSDDMPAHVKAALLGTQLLIPISGGSLALGTWQGIYLCEHRNQGASRRIVLTAYGQAKS